MRKHLHTPLIDPEWLSENITDVPEKSLVLFDIDGTIMNTVPRNHRILKEAGQVFPFLRGLADKMSSDEIGWNVVFSVSEKISLKKSQKRDLFVFWEERFFHDDWLKYDVPYPGVDRVLNWFIEKGILLVYLTGRDEKNMGRGTLDSFKEFGLPASMGTKFIFKPDQSLGDLYFKLSAFPGISAMGPVIMAFENEPRNANTMADFFPKARVCLIRTLTAPDPAEPDERIILFDGYLKQRQFL